MIERTHNRDMWTTGTALFSDCERYRYLLRIVWQESGPTAVVVGLNPSTATETKNDPTIERLERWARRNGYGSLSMLNAYGFRSTDPAGLWTQSDPSGADNDRTIRAEFCRLGVSPVAAWGANIKPDRQAEILAIARECRVELRCYALTKSGYPGHPLYMSDAQLDSPKAFAY
ncbi:MAG: DUF1643 domain-containing protein [Hyphomicrobiaceae bacterium]|nr:MAG: DUF1643 domain-containing protein [Hyphomicrobiaceae bacterium]